MQSTVDGRSCKEIEFSESKTYAAHQQRNCMNIILHSQGIWLRFWDLAPFFLPTGFRGKFIHVPSASRITWKVYKWEICLQPSLQFHVPESLAPGRTRTLIMNIVVNFITQHTTFYLIEILFEPNWNRS